MAVIVMTWTPTVSATVSYEVRYAVASPNPFYTYISTTLTSITIPGLVNGETYIVGVRSICDGGLVSEWSQQIVVVCDGVGPCHMEGTAIYVNNQTVVTYGVLYNWYAAADSRIAPAGWHTPTNTEWQALFSSVGSTSVPLKSAGTVSTGGLWADPLVGPSVIGTNSSGFNMNPSGVISAGGVQNGRTLYSNFWCSNDYSPTYPLIGRYYNFGYNGITMYTLSPTPSSPDCCYNKHYGFNIRLVKDNTTGYPFIGDVGTLTDIDGNIYTTKRMPDGKVWMTQNLRVSKYNDGAVIPVDPIDWATTVYGAIHSYV